MYRNIIKAGFALLKKENHYDQATIVRKLNYLNYPVSKATLSNVLNNKRVHERTLGLVSDGIRELIQAELGYIWEKGEFIKIKGEEWEPLVVKEATPSDLSVALKPDFTFHPEGRLPVHKKVDFIMTAQKEVIEFGVTLNTFSSYFISRSDQEYKSHVNTLLEKGINFKCYLLDPECNEASLYFSDRKREQIDEIRNIEAIRNSIWRLENIKKDLDGSEQSGKFEVLAYKHIPYNHFLVVDGNTPNGKMMVSHYIYGVPRAKCPVFVFSKQGNFDLYKKYWNSLKKLTKGAKPLTQH